MVVRIHPVTPNTKKEVVLIVLMNNDGNAKNFDALLLCKAATYDLIVAQDYKYCVSVEFVKGKKVSKVLKNIS